MIYMLDTNIVSDIARNPSNQAAQRFFTEAPASMISVVVAAELEFGLAHNPGSRVFDAIRSLLDTLFIAPMETNIPPIYGTIRQKLAKSGETIGNNDMLIAAHAIAMEAVLVTDNNKEFSRVPGLAIENWMR